MKKKLLLALPFLLLMGIAKISAQELLEPLSFEVRKVDETPMNHPVGKSPIQIPEVWLDDHTLTFDSVHEEYTLYIVSGDVVVYTTVVYANTTEVVLPSTLSGTFELQLIQDSLCFYGEIEL